ncbi:hypothetical protein SZ25_00615 [Candidatus Arcanobacter lacustris]|jgi:hypothetical protein|uniref:Uncharacterized protein n=1 Tax=Candidatus Arcanibacter lacustris TaxID=1607817 RepID=A0A0F5MNA3_9RICK|nr:hypothetical protein SZ25_00615 [Candidatus Arcanobacter lacustris]
MNQKSNLTIYIIACLIGVLVITGLILGNKDLDIKTTKKQIMIDQNQL